MPLSNITGESIYAPESYYVDAGTVISRAFLCRNIIYPLSTNVFWNGLFLPKHTYTVIGRTIIFDADVSLQVGDEISVVYTIGE